MSFWNVSCTCLFAQSSLGHTYEVTRHVKGWFASLTPTDFQLLRRQSMEYAFRNTLTRFLLALGVLALLTGIVWAQGGTGELTGLVTDPSGAVVSNAEVK